MDKPSCCDIKSSLFSVILPAVSIVACLLTSSYAVANNKLYKAVENGDSIAFEKYVKDKLKRNYRSDIGLSPLELAYIVGYREFVDSLSKVDTSTEIDIPPGPVLTDRYLTNLVAGVRKHPALVVSVSRDGEVLFEKAYGYANREKRIPATLNTQFRIGSISKQFTGAAIVLLEEQGKLSITDTLDMYLPDYPNAERITLEHLLYHSSGIPDYGTQKGFIEQIGERRTPLQIIGGVKDLPLDFEPGTMYTYSNTGYVILAYIIEHVSGSSYAEFMRENVFQKLGMNSSGVYDSRNGYPDEAAGYSYSFFSYRPAIKWDMSQPFGAGNIYSTVNDLRRWVEAYFSGRVIKPGNIKRATNPTKSPVGYGHGLYIWQERGLTKVFHGGRLHGYTSFLAHYPESGVTVSVLMAAGMPTKDGITAEQISPRIAELFLWQQMDARKLHLVDTDVNPDTYKDYVGTYIYPTTLNGLITRRSSKLYYKLDRPGKKKVELLSMGDEKFFANSPRMEIHFLRDSNGNIKGFKYFQEGLHMTTIRVH